MIVDDLEELHKLYRDLFNAIDIKDIKSCKSSKLGIAALNSDNFDLIITDLAQGGKLLGMEFVSAAKQIKPQTPIIVASGNVMASDYVKSISGLHLLDKPFHTYEFYELVCPLLKLPIPVGFSKK